MTTQAPNNLTLQFLQKLLAETEADVAVSSFEVRLALAAGRNTKNS
jgi:hypothetical protein